jgi:hydrogenase maturation protease
MRGSILVAGIGNIFLGDDAFGVEVVRRLQSRTISENICVKDFGIRAFDLACALTEPWDLVIMVDAASRGGRPGQIYLLDLEDECKQTTPAVLNAHGLNPVHAIELAHALGDVTARLVLVACEPGELGGEDGKMELSPAVQAALDPAIDSIERIAREFAASEPMKQGAQV